MFTRPRTNAHFRTRCALTASTEAPLRRAASVERNWPIGRDSRAHVASMGGEGATRPRIGAAGVVPMLYSRLNASRTAFEPERNLITWAAGLDGGGTVAADAEGYV